MCKPLVAPRRAGLATIVLVVFLAQLTPVLAGQVPRAPEPTRPFRGLFGPSGAGPVGGNVLDLNVSLYGAWDDNEYVDLVTPAQAVTPVYPQTGFYAGAQVGLDYRRQGRRLSFQASGGSGFRTYPQQRSLNGATPWESVDLSGSLGRRTTFSLSQAGFYSPYYGFGVFPGLGSFYTPGQVFMSTTDYSLYPQSVAIFTAAANLARRLSPRSSLSFDYRGQFTDFLDDPRSLLDQSIGARYSHSVTQAFGYRVGYTYHRGSYGYPFLADRAIQAHDLDVGVDYSRALDRTRRTTFGLSSGTSVVVTPTANYGYLLGSAFLNRSLGRTWNARFDYRRGLQFVEGFERPFFTDSIALSASGYFGRRVDVGVSAGYSAGALGLGAGGEDFGTVTGIARARFALSQNVALYGEGIYYHYLFGQGARPPGVPRGLDRAGVRGGLSFWLPLLR